MPNNKENEKLVETLAEAFAKAQQQANIDTNGASAVALEIQRKVNDRAVRQQQYANRISYEMDKSINCVTVTVPKVYYEYQPSFVISINGCTVKIPADGKARVLHKDFAVILMKRMKAIDDKLEMMRQNNGSDIRQIV